MVFKEYDEDLGVIELELNKEEAFERYRGVLKNVFLAWVQYDEYSAITNCIISQDLEDIISWEKVNESKICVFDNFCDPGHFIKDMNEGY